MEQERYDFVNMLRPCPVGSLKGRAKVFCIGGDNYHSFAVTSKGECITWGQCDTHVFGHRPRQVSSGQFIPQRLGEAVHLDCHYARAPHFANAVFVVPGCDQCLVVTRDGKDYSWGYCIQRRTEQGATEDRGSYPYRPFSDQGQENCVGGLPWPLQRLGRGGGCNDDWHQPREVVWVRMTEEA